MYIPNPIEIMEAQIERMCDDPLAGRSPEFKRLVTYAMLGDMFLNEFDGVHCMRCGKATDNFFPLTSSPSSPAVCEECASKEILSPASI
jgi:DNA-directed RNA polymerase subunit RPC12/RpoP